MPQEQEAGTLILIGGHEDREGDRVILREVARRTGKGKLVVTTVASHEPDGKFADYERVFRSLGVEHVYKLEIRHRQDAQSEAKLRVLDDATAIFFTGGDQLKITSQIGDTPVYRRIRDIYEGGGLIAGTSAGASAVCETMIVRGGGDESHRVLGALMLASGLGFINGVIIDQHFAERGRMGRLVGAIAENPRNLGIGLDEDTAIVVENNKSFYVLGSGAVYVIDGTGVTYSNIAEARPERTLSIYDIRMHILCQEDCFDLVSRRPGELTAARQKRMLAPLKPDTQP